MNDDLHTLFKIASDTLPIGPAPSRAALADRRRRQLFVRSAFAVPAVAVIAIAGGILLAGGSGPAGDRGVDLADSGPTRATTPGTTPDGSDPAPPPEQTPTCDGGRVTIRFVDWPIRSGSTALEAVEKLLGMPLPDAATDEVSAARSDVVVPATDGRVRAVVTVILGDDGWRPMSVYSCSTDSLRLAD